MTHKCKLFINLVQVYKFDLIFDLDQGFITFLIYRNYLIGIKKPNEYLFQNMTWSIDTVLSETIQRISMNNKTYHLLKTLPDIDTADDWEKHGWF